MNAQKEMISDYLINLDIDIDILNYIDIENVTDFSTLYNEIQDNGGFDIDIIYYYKAMKYLMDLDSSLQLSIELAAEMGYETEQLNSELLASLLASENIRNEFYNLKQEIDTFFNTLNL